MKRILVLGNAGSGKSTLATQLSALLDMPIVHLDSHFWQHARFATAGSNVQTWPRDA